jgi:hypothetical protein
MMAGPAPVSFTFGANYNLQIFYGIAGKIGVPEALKHEKAAWGHENIKNNIVQRNHIQLSAELMPKASLSAFGEVKIGVPCLEVGIGLEITVLSIGFPAVVAYNFNSGKTCFAVHMLMSALAGRFYLVAEVGWCPFCLELDITLFEWSAVKLPKITLFGTTCCHDDCTPSCQGGTCNRATGNSCDCYIGYVGRTCAEECPGMSKGVKGICGGNGQNEYDKQNNRMDRGCYFHNRYKATVCRCKNGFFGTTCKGQCPRNENGEICNGKGVCHPLLGTCTCTGGFAGKECTIKCPGHVKKDGELQVCNGNGFCRRTGAKAVCTCKYGYTHESQCAAKCPFGNNGKICSGANSELQISTLLTILAYRPR